MANRSDTNNDLVIEAKLQGVAATFRRERDEAHRQKELASERLRLTREEADAANKSLMALKSKLDELKKASGTDAEREIEQLKKEVDSLTNQLSFQHNELLGMREQLQRRVDKHTKDGVSRRNATTKLQEAIGPRREKVAKLTMAAVSKPQMQAHKKRLVEELQGDLDNNLYNKWPRIVVAKAEAISDAACGRGKEADVVERILAGYQRQFGFEREGVTVQESSA